MRTFVYLLAISLMASCAPARFVEPLPKKQLSIGANIGGPVLGFGNIFVPTPLSAIEVGYGLDTNLTVHGGLHVTSMFFGNAQVDGGITYRFLKQKKLIPNLSVNPGFNLVVDVRDVGENETRAKFWPTLDVNAYWNYGKRRNYIYLGANNYFELSSTQALDQPQSHHWLFSPQIGHVFKGRNHSWEFITEFKFLAPNIENTTSFIPYRSILGKHGATGFYLGFRKMIGRKRKKR